jgi:urease accessory protein
VLSVFKSVPVVDRTYRAVDLPEACRAYGRDTITLGWEERLKIRGRRRSDGGVEFGTALPRSTVLRDGDCFVVETLALVIAVAERAEPVFHLTPRDAAEWALFAYHIGNRHLPLMVAADGLVCPDVPGVELLLQQYGIPYARAVRAFTPAAAPVGHEH